MPETAYNTQCRSKTKTIGNLSSVFNIKKKLHQQKYVYKERKKKKETEPPYIHNINKKFTS